jgi:hypothetical protein
LLQSQNVSKNKYFCTPSCDCVTESAAVCVVLFVLLIACLTCVIVDGVANCSSVAVVVAYFMVDGSGMDDKQALIYVRSRHAVGLPNTSLRKQVCMMCLYDVHL